MAEALLFTVGVVVEGIAAAIAKQGVDRLRLQGHRRALTEDRLPRVVDGVRGQVTRALRRELDGVPAHESQAAVEAVCDSLALASITVDTVIEVDLRPEQLSTWVRQRSEQVRRAAGLGEAGQAFYDRVLAVACQQILGSVTNLPELSVRLQAEVLREVRKVRTDVERMDERPHRAAADFERRYRALVESVLGQMELFGIGRGRTHSLDSAYVNLAVARSDREASADDDDLTGSGLDVASAFRDHRRVFLRAGAGAGKTTLMQWLAVSAGRADSRTGAAWGHTVPFFVQLRRFAHGELPDPEDFPRTVAGAIAAEMPPGWVHEHLRRGSALVLVDGVDEIEQESRRRVREWLRGLVSAFGEARFVVSTRPFAVAEDWLAELGFATFDLLPLSSKGIRDLLTAWYKAAHEEYPADERRLEYLRQCEQGLAEQLSARAELRTLAGTPLLCGLLCALYGDRNMHLPRDRKSLYDSALDLLLVQWDERRKIDEVTLWPQLGREGQMTLLQRFAYWMVRHDKVVVSREEAVERFAHAMRGLRSPGVEPEPVLQRTLERTGLLREPHADEVQFVHRIFRDYLAAKEVVDAGDLDILVENAHLDSWYDVVVNAVAHARPKERDPMLRKLLDGNKAARSDEWVRDRLRLVAAACLEQAEVLGKDETRDMVREAAARLIPPRSFDDAELLAKAGPLVLDLLPGPGEIPLDQVAYVVRTLAMIGGEGVRDKLARFVPIGEAMVIDELLRAWRKAEDPESYARTVLADVDFGSMRLEVRGWHRVRCLPHLTKLTNVACYGRVPSLEPIAAVPMLRRLELVQNESLDDLRPLVASRTLRVLLLEGGGFLRDLSPLADSTVEDLGLYWVDAELGTLRANQLRVLRINDHRITDGLWPLPAELPIRELFLEGLPRSRSLLGVHRWERLEHVWVKGVPRPDEVEALTELPRLGRLTISRPEGAAELARLEPLAGLAVLDIRELPEDGIADVHAALRHRPGMELRINGRPVPAGE